MAMRLPLGGDDDEDAGFAPIAEINVTPMVDVMLVLLIIFMVAAPLMMSGVPLQLPKTAATTIDKPHDPVIISIDRNGQVFVGSDAVAADALQGKLAAMAAADPAQVVYVRGDRSLTYGRIMQIMGVVSSAGFSRVSLLAEQQLPPP
jgi:TolR protein